MSRNSERMVESRTRALKALEAIPASVIVDIDRRSRFRATQDSPGDNGPKPKGSISDPTGSHVAALLDGKNVADPIWEAARDFARTLEDIAQLAVKLEDKVRFITTTADKAGVRATTSICEACGRTVENTKADRCRSAYCGACYADWTRQGRPYRTAFEIARRAKIEASKGKTPPE